MSATRPGAPPAGRVALVAASVWLIGVVAANYLTNPAYHWYAWQLRELGRELAPAWLGIAQVLGTAGLLAGISTVFGLGFSAVRRIGDSDPLLALALAMAAGLAALGLASYGLCAARAMGPASVGILLSATLATGWIAGGSAFPRFARAAMAKGLPPTGRERWLAIAILVFLGATALGALAPARNSDDAAGHLPFALWLAEGGHPWHGHQFSVGYYPNVPHGIYAAGMTLVGLPGGRGINLLFLAASLVFVERLGRDLFGRSEPGLLAALLWVTTIPVGIYTMKTYLDVPYASYALGAALLLVRWSRTQASSDAGWAILFGAFSASAKSHGLVVFLLVATWVVGVWRPSHPTRARTILGFGLVSLAWIVPWYLRNYLVMGQPLYPYTEQTMTMTPGVEPDARSLLGLPFLAAFYEGVFILPLNGGVHLALVPIAVAVRRDRRVLAVLATAVLFSAIWFLTYQNVRYLLPALGLFSVLSGGGLAWFLSSGRATRWAAAAALGLIGLVASAALLGGNYVWDHRGLLQTSAVTFGFESQRTYLARHYAPYEAVEYANGLGEECTGILLEYGVEPIVYLDVPYVVVQYLAFRSPVCTEDEYPSFLVEHRVSHVLVDENVEFFDYISQIPPWRRKSWGERLFSRNGFTVYRARVPPPDDSR